ncbi:MAG: hypothetical protein WA902_10295 [Thermosynechococcaceae cyanobacterium]
MFLCTQGLIASAQTQSSPLLDQVQRAAQDALQQQQQPRRIPPPQATDSDGLPIIQEARDDSTFQTIETACPTKATSGVSKTNVETGAYEMETKVEPISSEFC